MSSLQLKAQSLFRESVIQAHEAVTSFGWLYPIRGITYFWSHERLREPLMRLILPSLAVSAAVLAAVFTFLYLPQAAVLSVVQLGPLGFVTAVGVCLGEAGFIINLILKNFILADTLTDTFDQTLLLNGLDSLVAQGREISGQQEQQSQSVASKGGKKLGKLLTQPLNRFKPEAIVKYIMTIPLNAIPLVGTPVFFAMNAVEEGPNQMARFHQLKKLDATQKKKFVRDHRGAYTAFGLVSLLLQLIPIVGPVVFGYSNQVGAALLAADLEKKQGKVVEGEREIKGGRKKEL